MYGLFNLFLEFVYPKEAASAGAKLLCLPENFSYVGDKDGDSLKVAETLDGPIMQGYCSLARWLFVPSSFLLVEKFSVSVQSPLLNNWTSQFFTSLVDQSPLLIYVHFF